MELEQNGQNGDRRRAARHSGMACCLMAIPDATVAYFLGAYPIPSETTNLALVLGLKPGPVPGCILALLVGGCMLITGWLFYRRSRS